MTRHPSLEVEPMADVAEQLRERIEREMDINEATIGEPVIYRDDLPDLFDDLAEESDG